MSDEERTVTGLISIPGDLCGHSFPLLPITVTIGGASIKLHADGSYEGDRDGVLNGIKAEMAYNPYRSQVDGMLLWLLANVLNK